VVDLDGVVDVETGEIREEAAEIVHAVGSYGELSCSQTGVHVVGIGQKPRHAKCRSKALGVDVEVYDRSRFVVLTGERFGEHAEPQKRQGELEELCQKLWPKKPKTAFQIDISTPVGLDDLELLERARRSRTGV
jgi:primase-polymerase (primpol)-like protein